MDIVIRQSFEAKVGAAADVTVFFDVFRASTTLAALVSRRPAEILSTNDFAKVEQMIAEGALLVSEVFAGGLDNSPSQILSADISAATKIVHKSTNLTTAIFAGMPAKRPLIGSFVNLSATAKHIISLGVQSIELVPAGHRNFNRQAIEDTLAAEAMRDLLSGSISKDEDAKRLATIRDHLAGVRARRPDLAAHYWEDAEIALSTDRFNHVLQADPVGDGVIRISEV